MLFQNIGQEKRLLVPDAETHGPHKDQVHVRRKLETVVYNQTVAQEHKTLVDLVQIVDQVHVSSEPERQFGIAHVGTTIILRMVSRTQPR